MLSILCVIWNIQKLAGKIDEDRHAKVFNENNFNKLLNINLQ